MKTTNEKIMIGVFAVSVAGFLIAPCCWTQATKTGVKSMVSCSGNKITIHDTLKQTNNPTAKNIQNNKH